MARPLLDLAGVRFGRLVAESRAPSVRDADLKVVTYWNCRCDCGDTCKVRTSCLRAGKTQSCGCRRQETARANYEAARAARWPKKEEVCHASVH